MRKINCWGCRAGTRNRSKILSKRPNDWRNLELPVITQILSLICFQKLWQTSHCFKNQFCQKKTSKLKNSSPTKFSTKFSRNPNEIRSPLRKQASRKMDENGCESDG